MTQKERQQTLILLMIIAVLAGGAFWMYWRTPTATRIGLWRDSVATLEAEVEAARRSVARGTVVGVRGGTRDYEAALAVMRELVPAGTNEVTTMIDDISLRAKRRGVQLAEWTPLSVEAGDVFNIYRYRYTVYGHYDQVGEFLADVASLRHIMVPHDLSLAVAPANIQVSYGDTTGTLLEARFQLQTFVKPASAGEAAGAGGGR